MRRITFNLLSIAAICLFLIGCKTGGGGSYQTSENGLEYRFHKQASADVAKAKLGDYITVDLKYTTPGDSVLFDTWKNKNPLKFTFSESLFRGALTEGLQMMSEGDSANFLVPVEKLYPNNLPPFLNAGDNLIYTVALKKVQSKAQKEADEKEAAAAQLGIDDEVIKKYMAENGISDATKTASGLYVITEKAGGAAKPKAGQNVKVHYTGYLLSGKKFDSSVDRGQPFEFPVGQGRVIKGWDEGIPMFGKGGKGTLLIPSPLGYGARGAGRDIPPNSVLKFDIELLDF